MKNKKHRLTNIQTVSNTNQIYILPASTSETSLSLQPYNMLNREHTTSLSFTDDENTNGNRDVL
jgi:hypothetical protein